MSWFEKSLNLSLRKARETTIQLALPLRGRKQVMSNGANLTATIHKNSSGRSSSSSLVSLPFGGANQVIDRRIACAQFREDFFGGNAAVHPPGPA